MRRSDLVARLAETTGVGNADAAEMLAVVLNEIRAALLRGEPVQIMGFGTFHTKNRQPRIGRNVHTGESVKIPALEAVSFRPSGFLKQAVRIAAKKWRDDGQHAASSTKK